MRLSLSRDSRVLVELRATGLLKAFGHDPVLVAHPEPIAFEAAVEASGQTTASFALRFLVARIDPPSDLSEGDRDRMRANMEAPDVLDAARFPAVEASVRWKGTLEQGRVDVDATVRGGKRTFAVDVSVQRAEGSDFLARGAWEGRLTDLGIQPFRALMGALKLRDWIRLRIEARLSPG